MDSGNSIALCLQQRKIAAHSSHIKGGPLATKKELVLKFPEVDRETKGTKRYSEEGDEPSVGKLYLKLAAAEKLGNPEGIVVTIRPL